MSSTLGRLFLINNCSIIRRKSIFSVNICKFSGAAAKPSTSSDDTNKLVIPAAVPGMIHAAVFKKIAEPLVIENIEPPKTLDPDEVMIDVHYCALNGFDVLRIKESHSSNIKLPKILGYEIAGKISQVGDAVKKNFKVGDKIVALNKDKFGGLAQKCKAKISDIWKIPSSVKTIDAVCLLRNYLIAIIALEKKADLEEDELVLINAGLGGIGLAAVDIAANVFRAQVIGVSLSEDLTTLVRDKGAFASLKFKDKKLVKKIEEFAAERDIKDVFEGAEGEKFKKILDSFTKIYKKEYQSDLLREDNFAVLIEHLSRKGRLIVAGFAATKSDSDDDDSDEDDSSFTITGINLDEYRQEHPESYREAGNDVLQYHEEGLIKPSYSLIAGLYRINDAVKFISDLKSSEKVIIDIRNPSAEMAYREKEQ